ncbi:MAG: UDP-N-acetylglucosamine--N-acetylmuramyl-(pentapeptide) pyrophosphoryl-undecaprenol N-acetylglucosamine transferase [Vampirovibrionales bacterium]
MPDPSTHDVSAPCLPSSSASSLLVTGGGTGGHIYPALALAEAGLAQGLFQHAYYLGTPDRLEATLVPSTTQLPFYAIPFKGMPRSKNPLVLLQWVLQLLLAIGQAYQLVGKLKPSLAIGTGGYVTAPALVACKLHGIPFMVHEPDAMPGLVTRLLARWANHCTGAFAGTGKRLKLPAQRYTCTGNPLRTLPTASSQSEETALHGVRETHYAQLGLPLTWQTRPLLVVLGGSLGATTLNNILLEALPTLHNEFGLAILHQTGEKLFDAYQHAYQERYPTTLFEFYRAMPYMNDMPSVWALAHGAICRSGSMTLSELACHRVPSLLVPYPYATANHQEHNARTFESAQLACVVLDSQLTPATLIQHVREWLLPAMTHEQTTVKQRFDAVPHASGTQAILAIAQTLLN